MKKLEINFNYIENLKKISWFSNCGQVSDFSFDNQKIDKNKINNYIYSKEWEEYQLEATNLTSLHIQSQNKQILENQWNDLVVEYKKELSFMDEIILKFEIENNLKIKDDVLWNVIYYFKELFILENNIKIKTYYDNIFEVYKKGNLVCGCIGEYSLNNKKKILYW